MDRSVIGALAAGCSRAAGPRLAGARRRSRTHAILDARSDHAGERAAAARRVDLSHRRRACRSDREIQCNPIVVHGVLYATSPQLKAFALDAGDRRTAAGCSTRSRGAAQRARSASIAALCSGRTVTTSASSSPPDERLYAIDAKTGDPMPSFGDSGQRQPARGPGPERRQLYVLSNTPGAIYKDLLILGTRVSEGPGRLVARHIRAFDVRTGKLRWIFHTIPWPGEFGYDTWPPDAWHARRRRQRVERHHRRSGRGDWCSCRPAAPRSTSGAAIVTARTCSPTACSCSTRRPANGVWHYQFVHHDVWDRDLPAAPVLVTVTHDGKPVDAVAQTTKSGFVFLFNRETGEPLFPIEERPVPQSDLQGRKGLADAVASGEAAALLAADIHRGRCHRYLAGVTRRGAGALRMTRHGGQFIPPSTAGHRHLPGFDGGAEWGGAAFDASTGLALRERQRDAVDPDDGRDRQREADVGRRASASASTRSTAWSATARS